MGRALREPLLEAADFAPASDIFCAKRSILPPFAPRAQPLKRILAHKDLRGLLDQLRVFGVIAGGLLVLIVAQAWLNQMTKVKLREWLVCDLFDEWLKPRRAFYLVNAGERGINPDQRIHEDARHLTELTTDLGIGLLQSSLLLGSFIGVLWILSQNVTFHVSGRSFGIPGASDEMSAEMPRGAHEFPVDEMVDCELAAPSGSQGPQGRGGAAVVYSGLRSFED